MISLGGGGNLNHCHLIIDALLSSQHELNHPLHISVVLGPVSENSQQIVEKYNDTNNVNFLIGKTELFSYLSNTHLYIGAAGGTLYQLLALQIPALTFSIAENQYLDKIELQGVGHYFHLDKLPINEMPQLASFVRTVSNNHFKFKQLIDQASIKIDALGASRISNKVLEKKDIKLTNFNKNEHNNSEVVQLSNHHQLRPVCDSDINHYLISRNLPNNSQSMLKTSTIPFLSHYTWWFNDPRESFLLSKNNKPSLYIWHEPIKCQRKKFIIAGWFVCQDKIGFQEPLLALKWQIDYCQKKHPDTPWVGIFHRKNTFAKLLNKHVGFENIGLKHAYYSVIQALFNGASFTDFYYFTFNGKNKRNKQ